MTNQIRSNNNNSTFAPADAMSTGDVEDVSGSVIMGKRAVQTMYRTQIACMVLLILMLCVSTIVLAWIGGGIKYAYVEAQPFLSEAQVHSLAIIRHVHNTTEALEQTMQQANDMTSFSVPELKRSLNETAAMVFNLQQMMKHPTIKMSLETPS